MSESSMIKQIWEHPTFRFAVLMVLGFGWGFSVGTLSNSTEPLISLIGYIGVALIGLAIAILLFFMVILAWDLVKVTKYNRKFINDAVREKLQKERELEK